VNFLRKREINNPKRIEDFIPAQYNRYIKDAKKTLGKWGVHCTLDSAQLGLAFGPSTFFKMIAGTKVKREEPLREDFKGAADVCLKVMANIFLVFMFLMSKGTKYQRKSQGGNTSGK
jgi:hypothetical protein